jgi:excisionase family DNA binding protein
MEQELQQELVKPVERKLVSITDAAKLNKVTRQAIYVAIKLNKLKAQKDSARWTIDLDDLDEYRKHKYSRAKSTFNGELIFNSQQGRFSVNQVARQLGIPPQKVYYATRSGKLKAERRGAAWVIAESEIEEYRTKYLLKKKKKSA